MSSAFTNVIFFSMTSGDTTTNCASGLALCNSTLETLRNHAVLVGGHENHIVAGLGVPTLAYQQAFVVFVISKDLREINLGGDLVKGRTKPAVLPRGFLILDIDAEALKFQFVVAKQFRRRPSCRGEVRVIADLAFDRRLFSNAGGSVSVGGPRGNTYSSNLGAR